MSDIEYEERMTDLLESNREKHEENEALRGELAAWQAIQDNGLCVVKMPSTPYLVGVARQHSYLDMENGLADLRFCYSTFAVSEDLATAVNQCLLLIEKRKESMVT